MAGLIYRSTNVSTVSTTAIKPVSAPILLISLPR